MVEALSSKDAPLFEIDIILLNDNIHQSGSFDSRHVAPVLWGPVMADYAEAEYYRRRADHADALASKAKMPYIKSMHRAMAENYRVLAGNAMSAIGTRTTGIEDQFDPGS